LHCRNETEQEYFQPKLTVGLDLGDRNSWYCVVDEAGQIQLEQRVRTTAKALREVFGAMPRSRIALEIGTHSPWISRLLSELGHEVIVANARHVRLIGDRGRPLHSLTRFWFAVVLCVALYDSIVRIYVLNHELCTSFLQNPFEAACRLTPPDTNELRLAARVNQKHLASEQRIELVQPNVPLDECSLTIEMRTFASL
jgi:transposase